MAIIPTMVLVNLDMGQVSQKSKLQQFIETVLTQIHPSGCENELELHDRIAEAFDVVGVHYLHHVKILIPAQQQTRGHRDLIFHNGSFFYTSQVDFLLDDEAVLEIKYKEPPELSVADNRQVAEFLTCQSISCVFLAMYDLRGLHGFHEVKAGQGRFSSA